MKVVAVDAVPLSLDLRDRAVTLGVGTAIKKDTVIVRVRTEDGIVGYGEALIDDERRQNTFGLLMSLNMLSRPAVASTTRVPTVAPGCARPAFARRTLSPSSGLTPWSSVSNSGPTS